jgi:beta-lactamase superfamily II metal-dependent hydrolase
MNRKTKQIMSRVSGIILLALLSIFINHYLNTPENKVSMDTANRDNLVEVHFIDVGQGDAILIEAENSAMLIDAGENNKGTIVTDYLETQNIKKLDYVIGTHPHSDHIGGLDTVINSVAVDTVILPSATHTTDTFEDLLDALEENNLSITMATVGDEYNLGPATFTVIGPNSSTYDDLNNYSVGIKLTFGDNSFLFTGDAGKLSEEEMLENGIDLSADVLKLSHHGSNTGNGEAFLQAVNPTYAMICVGADNDYGHPHVETLEAMLNCGIKVYRTDVQGTVVFTSDGKNISVNTQDYEITEEDLIND